MGLNLGDIIWQIEAELGGCNMNWFNAHLNWFYVLVFVIALIILAIVGFVQNNVIGYLIFLALNLLGGGWVLWRKGQSLWYLVLVGLVYIAFPFVVLLSKNKRAIQSEVTDESAQPGQTI